MVKTDYNRFVTVLNAAMDVYGRERTGTALALWWKVLQPFTMEQVEAGLSSHLRTCRFAPTPADIIAAICSADGRPTADEAWAMIPRSESESVIWTDEMSYAYGIAAPLLEAGDAVAARRAFIDAYEGSVAKARSAGKPVKAWPSWGWDASGREIAVTNAVERGLLTHDQARGYLPAIARTEIQTPLLQGIVDKLTKQVESE
jgi:hypothetical protein